MLNKSIIAITAIVVLGSVSAAIAYEDPENRIGDRYSWLDQSSRTYSARNFGGPYVPARQVYSLDQPMIEDVEARIGDRYPALEQTTPRFSAARALNDRVAMRQVRVYYEDPASHIGDKYPPLGRVSPQRSGGVYVVERRQAKPRV